MKSLFPSRWPALALASSTLFLLAALASGCSRNVRMDANEDASQYVDYPAVAQRIVGMDAAQVQRLVGPPDDIERTSNDANARTVWRYSHRFCERDARCVYKHVTLVFENRRLVSITPE